VLLFFETHNDKSHEKRASMPRVRILWHNFLCLLFLF